MRLPLAWALLAASQLLAVASGAPLPGRPTWDAQHPDANPGPHGNAAFAAEQHHSGAAPPVPELTPGMSPSDAYESGSDSTKGDSSEIAPLGPAPAGAGAGAGAPLGPGPGDSPVPEPSRGAQAPDRLATDTFGAADPKDPFPISSDPYPLKEGPSPGAAGPDPDALPRPDVDPDALDKDADGKAPLLPGQDGAGDSNAAGDSDGPKPELLSGPEGDAAPEDAEHPLMKGPDISRLPVAHVDDFPVARDPYPMSGGSPAPPPAVTSTVEIMSPVLPVKFEDAAEGLPQHTVSIHGTKVTFAVTQRSHIALILGHVKRELHGYALMRDAINNALRRNGAAGTMLQSVEPLVVDVGSNHGLYAIYAAALGAQVIAVEPQAKLCKVIKYAAALNGEEIAGRITLYNNAVLERPEVISMSMSEVAEGAVATVKRAGGGGIQALPIATLAPPTVGRISFLKIDVEGFELHAIRSALPLFQEQRVDHAFVEFGPPSRWNVAGQSEKDGLALLKELTEALGLEPRLMQSYAWNSVMKHAQAKAQGAYEEAMSAKSSAGMYLPLSDERLWPSFMAGMNACKHCEAELWLSLNNDAAKADTFPTFGGLKPCIREKGDSNKKHRKPCFQRDLGDGLQTGAENKEVKHPPKASDMEL